MDWWLWTECFGCAWHKEAHINEQEIRAALLDLQKRTRSVDSIGVRYLSLIDSQVALGVLTKRRSSSHELNRVTMKMDALELASGANPLVAYCRSAHDPADRPSRRAKRRRLR